MAEAAASKEVAEALRSEIETVKEAAADERVEYELRLAGARSVKAARRRLVQRLGCGEDTQVGGQGRTVLQGGRGPRIRILRLRRTGAQRVPRRAEARAQVWIGYTNSGQFREGRKRREGRI